jgi:hypothetical protein
MKYTVTWAPEAESKLADLWSQAKNRESIRRACDELDALLSQRPRLLGESRGGSRRIAFAIPVAIEYEIFEADRLVVVLAIWSFRTR